MALPAPRAGTTVLITGASAGIGSDLARELAARGHATVLVARRVDRMEALAEELRELGVEADVLGADVADDEARAGLVAAVGALGKTVIGLCNNAGVGSFGRFHELDRGSEQAMVRLNVLALHDLTAAFLPGMVAAGEGAILNVASIAGYQPIPGNATYAATKAFVQSFSEAIHAELAGSGVSVTTLNPGPVKTEFGALAGAGAAEDKLPGFVSVSAQDVARAAVDAMEKGRRTIVPGAVTKMLGLSGRFMPRTLLLPAAARGTRGLGHKR